MKRMMTGLVLAVIAVSACAGGDPAAEPSPDTAATTRAASAGGFPVEVAGITVPVRPERIVSLSATHTEILYALGAGDRVVATDSFSNYPDEAVRTQKLDAFNLSVEAVARLDPDLVVYSFDPGDAAAGFDALGIPALLFFAPAALEEAYRQILDVGDAVGEREAAEELVSGIRAEIDEIVSSVPRGRPMTYFHELDSTLYTVTSETFVGRVYGLFGMENVADAADADGTGYPQLSAEYLVMADPDLIFLGDTAYGESAETVAARPGWAALRAVQEGRIVELDSDVASRWGPRIVELVRSIADALAPASAG